MKISIVIPAYNEEKYIAECLSSIIRNKTKYVREIILVDNGSKDRTIEIASRFPDVTIHKEPRRGNFWAKQTGFAHATGDIIAMVDADVRIPKGWFETIQSYFANNPNLVCLSGPYHYYDLPLYERIIYIIYNWILAFPTSYISGYRVTGGNAAFRRNVLEKIKEEPTHGFEGEDTYFGNKIHKFGKVRFYPWLYVYSSGRRLRKHFFRQGMYYFLDYWGLWEILGG
jgi:glycosyltransferase involved in cell wall biosynthesis